MENPFEIIQQQLFKVTEMLERLLPQQVDENRFDKREIMSIKEAAIYLSIAKPTLYHYTSTRNIPHFKRGKKIYFIRQELLTWIEKGKVKTKQEIENEATNYVSKYRKNR